MDPITLDQAIDTVMQLPVEQRAMLIEIIRSRDIENRRKEIAEDARKSIAAFHAGQLRPQPVGAIIDNLRKSLGEVDEE